MKMIRVSVPRRNRYVRYLVNNGHKPDVLNGRTAGADVRPNVKHHAAYKNARANTIAKVADEHGVKVAKGVWTLKGKPVRLMSF